MKETSNIKYYVRAILFAAILLILDQVTKYLAVIHLKNQNPAVLIQNVFEFQYLENQLPQHLKHFLSPCSQPQ